MYTPEQVLALTPVRNSVENLTNLPDLRDVFLCHAWDDRKEAAKELHDLLESHGVSVWFSEKDVGLGVPLLRAIDKGLANSRVGIVHETIYEALREVSPLLSSRSGLNTAEEPMAEVAAKLAELVAL
ncbi:toll/interleukin-1 receptor domain-containing protein [Bacillus cereus]|uniref:toll/interleukin-1 receptor domain-containing protein n=1 Tax=Bacillus thuringiensis TaxID=1428 RepID=UPI001F512EB9|nr:toll/interleukin-1 receptor domain-containing protein [Bacillus cereus]MEB9725453.1 toll/interleukin-1 receptor domain-containing protein [Bacillus cereus]MEC2944431.1 toll/interleukin-1 receptor domain-containing protein [Bacillus cereus]MEC3175847.1 toll/interleukin-1 receptor domain-containing protein [Bacillus cereus]